jgi:hypothetical protein
MSSALVYSKFEADAITPEMIKRAASLFSNHYGVWGPLAGIAKQGQRVRMGPSLLTRQCFAPSPARNFYVQVKDGDDLVGNVLATRWVCAKGDEKYQICWVTQLCISSKYRNQGLATEVSLSEPLTSIKNRGRAATRVISGQKESWSIGRQVQVCIIPHMPGGRPRRNG